MSLPKFNVPREPVEIDGEIIEVRGLTRGEAARCQKLVDGRGEKAWSELELAMIGYATETPADEVKAWYEKAPTHLVAELVNAIKRISQLDAESPNKSGAGNSPGD